MTVSWFLEAIEIEGFRGVNNEGDPLVLKFPSDKVSSVSAPNGVGKTSIFDALEFAIRGRVKKLDDLPSAEDGGSYYINRFHSQQAAVVSLTVSPVAGGSAVKIVVTRDSKGRRVVKGPAGVDANALLRSLDRDFVLLDYATLQSFMDYKPLDRGRAFAGLLGLARYSECRQSLQALTNTLAFNNHVDLPGLTKASSLATQHIKKHEAAAAKGFRELTGEAISDQADEMEARAKALSSLAQIPVLAGECSGKEFATIDVEKCVASIRSAEGGSDKDRLSQLLKKKSELEALLADGLTENDYSSLIGASAVRDGALSKTAGKKLHDLHVLAREIVSQPEWADERVCPTCDHIGDDVLLTSLDAKLTHYLQVTEATSAITTIWTSKNWSGVVALEKHARSPEEPSQFADADRHIETKSLTEDQVKSLWSWRTTLLSRVNTEIAADNVERLELEKKLPPSLVAVTTLVEAARRLQSSWSELEAAQATLNSLRAKIAQASSVKSFLDLVSERFANAEATASTRRLSAVEPLCQVFFDAIMHQPVKPALLKPKGSEELSLSLAQFWTLTDVSARALLSESFRNAFAVSVYLAAASLYGGAPRFVVLDDITSSFDAGHQFHLMELVRTKFARPGNINGPQVILLSHDTLLEKLFNRNVTQGGWSHQRIEGTARTAVLPQSNAVNRVRDRTIDFLNAGRVDDAAPRVRQYLEYTVLEIIGRLKIPVPIDFALDDQKKQPQAAIDAVDAAIKLHTAAGDLILDATQRANLSTLVASITGNFLAHYATGSTQSFSASALLGIMAAIDDYAECFRFEHPAGSGRRQYYRTLSSKL